MTYNLHLESRANDDLRLSQLEEVVSDAARYDLDNTLIVAGDLNLNASKHRAGVSLLRAGFHDALPAGVRQLLLHAAYSKPDAISTGHLCGARFRQTMRRYTSRSKLRIIIQYRSAYAERGEWHTLTDERESLLSG
jgi:hypothetical protein